MEGKYTKLGDPSEFILSAIKSDLTPALCMEICVHYEQDLRLMHT